MRCVTGLVMTLMVFAVGCYVERTGFDSDSGSGPVPDALLSCSGADGTCDTGNVCEIGRCGDEASGCAFERFAPAGTPCPEDRVCDGAGKCVDCVVGAVCDTGNPCEVGELQVNNGACECVSTGVPAESGKVCREAAGVCDVAETCNGISMECPGDSFAASTTSCRGSRGVCDAEEFCTGNSASCPSDLLKRRGTECRGSRGACDVAESCTGTSVSCPVDGFRSSMTVCREASGQCDAVETCTGTSAACPGNLPKPPGTPCNDGNACTSDRCSSFSCRGTPRNCDDRNVCTNDFCVLATGQCGHSNKPNGTNCGACGTCQSGRCVGCPPFTRCCGADRCVSVGEPCP